MKKLLTLLLAGSIFTTATMAQGAKTTTKQEVKKETQVTKKVEPAKPAAPKMEVQKAEPVKPAAGMKKDGTPDMRMKENKMKAAEQPAKPAGPTKKDGTPDMRYKENKDKKVAGKKG